MYYIVQENVFRDVHYDRIVNALQRLQLEYEVVSLNDKEDFSFKTDRKDVFCFGSIKLARLATKHAWNPGSLMNENHDYAVYAPFWTTNMLNWDSRLQAASESISFSGTTRFIRPSKDSKIFTGKVFDEVEWKEMQSTILSKGKGEELIQVAHPKQIYQEIRCWVVDRKVISASTYKQGDDVRYTEYSDPDGLHFANEMAGIYQPADAFVLDICLTDQGWKIVEVNCINSAGFYACNLQQLLFELEEYYG